MADSKIEWTEKVWNPVAGCDPVSPGCTHCYAATMARRLEAMGQEKYIGTAERRGSVDVFTGRINFDEAALSIPLRWKKPRRVFVNSMSDLFHKDVPDEFIRRVFGVMSSAGQHTFQILTKRPERMAAFFADPENSLSACQAEFVWGDEANALRTPTGRSRLRNTSAINGTRGRSVGDGNHWPLPNVWLGTSVEDQKRADERIPHLLKVPAAVRFLSVEPLLGPVDLTSYLWKRCPSGCTEAGYDDAPGFPGGHRCNRCHPFGDEKRPGYVPSRGIGWVIVGGESGHGARQCDIEWIREIVRQCKDAGVACFVKQLGAKPFMGVKGFGPVIRDPKGGDIEESPADLRVRQFPTPNGSDE